MVVLGLAAPLRLAAATPITLTAADAVNGVITIPYSSTNYVINGNGQVAVSVWWPSYWNDPVTLQTNGSVLLNERHATGEQIVLTNVPTVYYPNQIAQSMATLQFYSSVPPPVVITAPQLPAATQPGQIVALQLRNGGATDMPSRVVTFGQAFVDGDLPSGAGLTALVLGGGALPVQFDVKRHHADGSVRHAVVAIQAPPIPANSSVTVMLSRSAGSSAVATSPLQPSDILASGWDVKLALANITGGALASLSLDGASTLANAASYGGATPWLQNGLVSEYRIRRAIDSHLAVTFDIRAAIDGSITTDVIVGNEYGYVSPATYSYDVSLTQANGAVWSATGLTQYRAQNWHHVVQNMPAGPEIVFDVNYLERSGAIPNLDTSLGLQDATLTYYDTLLAASNTAPLGSALVTTDQGQTGQRDDIGPVTTWEANWLQTQDPRAATVMFANADVSGAAPWHLRETNGQMLSVDAHPNLWLDDRCSQWFSDCITGGFGESTAAQAGWELDTAHEADLTYIPYLVTGSHYYLDELEMQANWTMLAASPQYRQGGKALFYVDNQVRGTAWNLRDVSNAGWIADEASGLGAYFATHGTNNLQGLFTDYITNNEMAATGQIRGYFTPQVNASIVKAWEVDYMALELGQETAQGYPYAAALAGWTTNFVAGLFTHGQLGFSPLEGAAYQLNNFMPNGQMISSWSALYQQSFSGPPPTAMDGSPGLPDSYVAQARAGVAALFTATSSTEAMQAFAFICSQSQSMLAAFQTQGGRYDVNPRLPDGNVLKNSAILTAPAGGGTLSAPGSDYLLIGSSGPSTLIGSGAISILFAGSGATTLTGAVGGINYFYGGSGSTTINAHAGANQIAIGSGAAQLNLSSEDGAMTTIMGFKPGIDRLHVQGFSPAAVLKALIRTSSGAASARFGGNQVMIWGVAPSQIPILSVD